MDFRKEQHFEIDENHQGFSLTEFLFDIEDDINNDQIVDCFLKSEYYIYDSLRDCLKKEPNNGYLRSAFNIEKIEIADFRKYKKDEIINLLEDFLNEYDWGEDRPDFKKLLDKFLEIINQSDSNIFYFISKDWFERTDEKLIEPESWAYTYYFLIILINRNSNSLILTEWTYD